MQLTKRKGAQRRSEIPPDVLVGLNRGRLEAVNLVEWLAVDMPYLLRAILPDVGLADAADELGTAADQLAQEGVSKRIKGIGAALFEALRDHPARETVFENLATHTSDTVRAWASFAAQANPDLPLAERLDAARRFAADWNTGVRENAWDSFRPHLVEDLEQGIALLVPWVHDPDPNIRRCASEATRPRGVWTPHIPTLKEDPEPGLALLEPLRSDPSRYVQNSVANWLNDASKSRPDWVQAVCARWLEESPTKETRYIVNRALRTLRKQGAGG